MGKKSRLKRARRTAKAKIGPASLRDQGFRDTCAAIRSLMARYRADDVFMSLCASDLWLPNISSQVKHTLAWVVALSMPAAAFAGDIAIKSYSDFKCFIEGLYSALPSFLSLEDYVPETDWGEIRCVSKGVPLRIFYGGAVERIPDFITAFHLVNGTNAKALEDMHLALLAQDQLLSGIAKAIVGVAVNIKAGHVETPSEEFWVHCREMILTLGIRSDFKGASTGLILKLGAAPIPGQMSDFADAVMTGSALPGFLVEIGDRRYPVALRNAAAAVIQYWADQSNAYSSAALADFIFARTSQVIKGPLQVVTRAERQPFVYSAAILNDAKPYLVIALGEAELSQLPQIESSLKRALRTGDWALQGIGERGATQIRGEDGVPQDIDQLIILAILFRVTTVPGFLKPPKTKARILPLVDFVTVFDSIADIDELDRYWAFVDSNAGAIGPFSGPVDRFAAFRDFHALLADGAVVPTMFALDPHWGSTWRHRILTNYWENAPPLFPDVPNTAWNVERDPDGVYTLLARRLPAISRSVAIGSCVAHFVLIAGDQPFELNDGRVLELLQQCLVDSLNQRKALIADLSLFAHRKIVTVCKADMSALVSQEDRDYSREPLFSGWDVADDAPDGSIHVVVQVNLQHVQVHLANTSDASFEVAAAIAWIEGLSSALRHSIDPTVIEAVRETSKRRPRFTMRLSHRTIDVPDHADPQVPEPENYKLARRDLAIAFKEVGAETGTYELAEAKALIDPARDKFRALVHNRIASLDRSELVRFCIQQIDELTTKYVDADKVLALLILDPNKIRRLLGKPTVEGDVPLWEHNKRGDRYAIKPIIQDEGGNLAWGAATAERSARIWRQSLINGYLPADFDWPNVKAVVRDIKQGLEKRLETTAAAVLARAASHVREGLDFRDRFPAENFDDVGDFDGLAYWPALNVWVSVECKYNQPAFCLKDARRLRDRIFGTTESREQIAKIERRRAFLGENLDRIRSVLGWPAPASGLLPKVHELYVSREIYWWMRNPPYPVATQFVRVDALDGWLRSNGLLP